MAELYIEFNCMCLFATENGKRAVHVLMPTSHEHEHPHHDHPNGHDHDHAPTHPHAPAGDPTHGHGNGQDPGKKIPRKHFVRLLYIDHAGKTQPLPMEGWALTLASRDPVHDSAGAVRQEARVANLTSIAGLRVNTDLLAGTDKEKLAARVTIDGGKIERVDTQPDVWQLGETSQIMAHQVAWRIPNLDPTLRWESIGASGDAPLRSLDEVQATGQTAEGEPIYRVYVYHVLERDLPQVLPPNKEPTLPAAFVIEHFPMYYGLMREQPSQELKPTLTGLTDGGGDPSGMHACKTAQVWDDPVLV
jgi:hypothetical protein